MEKEPQDDVVVVDVAVKQPAEPEEAPELKKADESDDTKSE